MVRALKSILKKFHTEIDYSLKLVNIVDEVSNSYKPPRGLKLSKKELNLITELAFLKIFVAYEIFMEQTFIGFMLGKSSRNGFKPKKFVMPKDEEHARKMTLQDFSEYTDWTSPDKIKRRAEYCFKNGEPFNINISSRQNVFQDIKTIRNHITHASSDSQEKFNNLIRKYLTTIPINKVIDAGEFLLMTKPNSKTPQNFINFFSSELKDFSEQLIP